MTTNRNILSIEKSSMLSLCAFALGLVVLLLLPVAAAGKASAGMFLWKYTRIAPLAAFVSPNDAGLQFAMGNYYFGGGAYDLEKAQEYLRKALEIDPGIEGAHYQLGRTHFIQSGFYDALQEINKELELHPDFKRSYYMRGLVYGYTKRYAEAESDFKTFLEWKPQSWAGHNDLAWVYFQEGKYEDVIATAREGLKQNPANPWLLNSLGVALLNTGEKKEAKEAFTKALAGINAMSPEDWGRAYPGNNPQIYGEGFFKMKEFIEANIKLLDTGDI